MQAATKYLSQSSSVFRIVTILSVVSGPNLLLLQSLHLFHKHLPPSLLSLLYQDQMTKEGRVRRGGGRGGGEQERRERRRRVRRGGGRGVEGSRRGGRGEGEKEEGGERIGNEDDC